MKHFFGVLFVMCHYLNTGAQTTEIKYLSGTDAANTVKWEFFCSDGRKSGKWDKIEVPSCWEQQGFGHYDYGRDYKTNGKNFRFSDEYGLYKYRFQVPSNWKDKVIEIVFDGSMTDTEVKINGKSAGAIHRGAFYRFKYRIDSLLKFGQQNILEVKVSKMSTDASVNNAERLADYWIFGGIFRPVFLEAKPKAHIRSVGIDALHKGRFRLQAEVTGGKKLVVSILDNVGNPVSKMEQKVSGEKVLLETEVKNTVSWTAETPNLYTVKINLLDAKGNLVHERKEKFGFRTIEVRRGDGVYINDVQVKFKGVNRHCFWPETGRTLSREQQLKDVQLLKEMNMNAVRCSHYPPDKYFLELCDSLGIYVIDELAGWQKAYSTSAGSPLVKEMVERDANHPSIIFWANGNEGGTNKSLDEQFGWWDFQKRPVIHPHHRPGNAFSGIDCNHYEDYTSTTKILNDSLIYMPTEFLHAQDDGGGAAGMEDFWNLHWKSKRSAGGFIWVFSDEAIMRTDMNNVLDANGLNANDGILGPHREKEGSYYALREIFSPVQIKVPSSVKAGTNVLQIEVENRYHFTNLSKLTLRKEWVNFQNPFSRTVGYDVLSSSTEPFPSLEPGKKQTLFIDLQGRDHQGRGLVLTALDATGNAICKWSLKIGETYMDMIKVGQPSPVKLTQSDSTIELTGGDLTAFIHKRTGTLIGTKNKSSDFQLSFNQGPNLTAGNGNLIAVKEGKDQVRFEYDGAMKSITWSISENGWLKLDYVYDIKGEQPFRGISFNYPENYMLGTRWLGKGPARQWKNRMAGTPISVWQNVYNNTQTGYNPIQYPEFKGYYGEISWIEFNTVEGKFFVVTPDSGMFVRLYNFYGVTTTGKVSPVLPGGDISFLDGIPGVGTKLAMGVTGNAAVYGPMGAMNPYKGEQHKTLYFYFGMPKLSNKEERYSRPVIDNVF